MLTALDDVNIKAALTAYLKSLKMKHAKADGPAKLFWAGEIASVEGTLKRLLDDIDGITRSTK